MLNDGNSIFLYLHLHHGEIVLKFLNNSKKKTNCTIRPPCLHQIQETAAVHRKLLAGFSFTCTEFFIFLFNILCHLCFILIRKKFLRDNERQRRILFISHAWRGGGNESVWENKNGKSKKEINLKSLNSITWSMT